MRVAIDNSHSDIVVIFVLEKKQSVHKYHRVLQIQTEYELSSIRDEPVARMFGE